ncbi:MAG TPA: YncE family protein [Acidobacteriaceae bacterium]|jgi:YVTN family beta-propeller protein|nr:YncE family protein [Acidobacteriaceae bacterium]
MSRGLRLRFAVLFFSPLLLLAGCHRYGFPDYPANYHEFAYLSDGAANTVTVLDLVYVRQDRVLQVGRNPTGLAVNPVRDEVYAVNTGSDSVSVIDTATNRVTATIGVHHRPYFIAVAPDGHRAYVPNSASNNLSVLDLDTHREIATVATGEGPGIARVSPDNRTLVVTNEHAGSVSIYSISGSESQPLEFRDSFPGCTEATDAVILPDSSKAFIACSGSHQVMALWLAASPKSWRGRQDASLQHDQLLTFLDVGDTPTHLALKPDGGEVFSTNFGSDSISEISTWTNEVLGTYIIGAKPSRAIISRDDSTLWVSNFGADSVSLYSIDDGRMELGVRTGSRPDALALSADEHLLLVADTGSADVAVIRTESRNGPALVTLLPAGNQPNDLVIKAFRAK